MATVHEFNKESMHIEFAHNNTHSIYGFISVYGFTSNNTLKQNNFDAVEETLLSVWKNV